MARGMQLKIGLENTSYFESLGFVVVQASPCNIFLKTKELHVIVHREDFIATGPADSLSWFAGQMGNRYEITVHILGPEIGMEREIRVLNRTLQWLDCGITYEPDQRHAEIIVRELGLEGGQSVISPIVADTSEQACSRDQSPELVGAEASRYRAISARLNYLALDRPDLQFTAKSASKFMACPRQVDWGILKRVGRYLLGAPRSVQLFYWQKEPSSVTSCTDSDWAGDKFTRKSTSGGVMKFGGHVIKSWSTTQHCIAMSSGEAELYALVKGAAQTRGLMSMLADFGRVVTAEVCTDASAAIGMAHRQGLGKTRHVDVQYLWIQAEVAEGRLAVKKVGTKDNLADIFTKALSRDVLEYHLHGLGFKVDASRAMKAPKLHGLSFPGRRTLSDACAEGKCGKHCLP